MDYFSKQPRHSFLDTDKQMNMIRHYLILIDLHFRLDNRNLFNSPANLAPYRRISDIDLLRHKFFPLQDAEIRAIGMFANSDMIFPRLAIVMIPFPTMLMMLEIFFIGNILLMILDLNNYRLRLHTPPKKQLRKRDKKNERRGKQGFFGGV